jgi:hypothetical protein
MLINDNCFVPDQIYDIDKSGLNYKMLPQKTLASNQEKAVSGIKVAKETVTVAACSNVSGKNKRPLFVIGTSCKRRAFQNLNSLSLPVYYCAQLSVWMDATLFRELFHEEILPAVSRCLKSRNLPEKALLVLDNAPSSHPNESELKKGNIKAVFLPAEYATRRRLRCEKIC